MGVENKCIVVQILEKAGCDPSKFLIGPMGKILELENRAFNLQRKGRIGRGNGCFKISSYTRYLDRGNQGNGSRRDG
ncbi:MAG: hypothetical protein Q7T59_03555 [Candidatus Woesebacteria bacterium]|nr:hypothetical protein [Candidatus Woesebacteria bacterium]